MRRLVIDVETLPNIVATYNLKRANIGVDAILEPSRMLCFAAGWIDPETNELDPSTIEFHESWTGSKRKQRAMVKAAVALLDEADVVIHYNGARFDEAKIRGEAVLQDLPLWSPFQRVDLLNTTKRLGFPSAKLAFVARHLGVANKLDNDGMPLWLGCVGKGDRDPIESRADMEEYNVRDVVSEGQVYRKLFPYIEDHPHWGLYMDNAVEEVGAMVCHRCGGPLRRSGYYRTKLGLYREYRCKGQGRDPRCRAWHRGKKAIGLVDARGVRS